MADARLRFGWASLFVLVGCSRCNEPDPCDSDDCLSNSDTSTGVSSEGGADDVAPESSGSVEASEDESNSEAGSASTGIDDGQCHGTDECAASEVCVAPYGDNVRGAFACVTECVGPKDETVWCFDHEACCDPTALCTTRGYCVSADAGSTGADASSSDGGSDSSSGTTG